MDVDTPRSRKPIRLNVQSFFRVVLYLGFCACVLATIAMMTWGGSWAGPMFGSVAFGIPAVLAYLTEQEQQQNLAVVKAAQRAMRGDGGGWDLDGDDDSDPTVPPTRKRTS